MASFPLNLGRQSNTGEHPQEGVARLINCRPEIAGEEQKVQWPIRATEGQTALGTLPGSGGGVAAMLEYDGVGLAVSGRSIVQFNSGGSSTALGAIPSDGHVDICVSDREAAIVRDGLMRVVRSGSVIEVTDSDAGAPISACVVNNHIVTVAADGNIRASELLDGTDWSPLDKEKALRGQGRPLRVVDRSDTAVVFGTKSFAVWRYNGSNDGLPFQPDHFDSVGCWGARSVAAAPIIRDSLVTKAICWAAADHQGAYAGICMLDGYTARKISTPAVDRDMRDATSPGLIRAIAWTNGGHAYVAWTIPDVTTWVYDTATSLWHERQSYNSSTWNVGACCTLNGANIVGMHDDTDIRLLSADANAEASQPLVVKLQTPPLHAFPNRVEINELSLNCVTGVGLNTTTPADLDPVVMMEMTRDGETWGTVRSRALGRQGQNVGRVAWHGLGTTDHRGVTFRFSASAAVVRSFMQGSIDGAKVRA